MSFRLQPAAPARPNRCQLFGPGSNTKLFPKMAASAADVINLDLEDSVSPTDKDAARANIIEAINTIDWGNKYLSVRINSLDTPFWYRDVVDLLEQAGDRLDQIMIPKVGCAADVYAVDALITAIEAAKGRKKPVSPTVSCRSMARLVISQTMKASAHRRAVRRRLAWLGNGRSIPSKSRWPMRFSHHQTQPWPRRARSSPQWKTRKHVAKGPRFTKGVSLILRRSNRPK